MEIVERVDDLLGGYSRRGEGGRMEDGRGEHGHQHHRPSYQDDTGPKNLKRDKVGVGDANRGDDLQEQVSIKNCLIVVVFVSTVELVCLLYSGSY